jgi:glycosyltransferase involved in cell wall biosynthesis
MVVVHANHLVSIGHEVRIISAVIDTVFVIDPRVIVELLPSRSKFATIVSALTTKFKTDLVVADIIAMVFLLSIRNRSKVVCFGQDYDESYYDFLLKKLLIRFIYFLALTLERIPALAVSLPLAELLRRRFRARATVVENGVDTTVFFRDPDFPLLSLKGESKAVVLFSRSDQRKGFDSAIEVFKRLGTSFPGTLEVWTIGERCPDVFLDFVHRDFGYLGEERLRQILSSADLLLYPTRHEGFGLLPLEAMACGCAVVTTSAVPYAVHGENALVSPIDDIDSLTANLITLLADEHLRNNLVQNAGKYAASCTLEESKRKFHAALLELFQR